MFERALSERRRISVEAKTAHVEASKVIIFDPILCFCKNSVVFLQKNVFDFQTDTNIGISMMFCLKDSLADGVEYTNYQRTVRSWH